MSRPSRISSSRSQRSASSITWLDTSTRCPGVGEPVERVPRGPARSTGSSPTVGSSSTSRSGLPSSATARLTRLRWPPDSRPTTCVALVGQVDGRRRPGRPPSRPNPSTCSEEPEVLGDRQVVVDARGLGDVADPVAQRTAARPARRRRSPSRPRRAARRPGSASASTCRSRTGPSRPVTPPPIVRSRSIQDRPCHPARRAGRGSAIAASTVRRPSVKGRWRRRGARGRTRATRAGRPRARPRPCTCGC